MSTSTGIALGVNIDHVATLRQARRIDYPDPVHAALLASGHEVELVGAGAVSVGQGDVRVGPGDGPAEESDVRLDASEGLRSRLRGVAVLVVDLTRPELGGAGSAELAHLGRRV